MLGFQLHYVNLREILDLVPLQLVNFMACKLYSNKAILNDQHLV